MLPFRTKFRKTAFLLLKSQARADIVLKMADELGGARVAPVHRHTSSIGQLPCAP